MLTLVSRTLALLLGAVVVACGGDDGASDENGNGNGAETACERGCTATLAADCDNGPESESECVSDCEALEAGDCSSEYSAFQTCAEGETISCNSDGIPAVEACDDEQSAFIACLTAG